MSVVTGVAQKEAWELHVLPQVEQIRPGLWSIPVPLPDNPLRYVLVHLLELDGGGVALVDAGWDTEEAWHALVDGLATAGGSVSDVRSVLVTHIHPDHYGLAGRIREATGAWIGLHPHDAEMLHDRYADTDDLLVRMQAFLRASGVPEDMLPDLNMASMVIRDMVSMAQPDILFEDGGTPDVPGWDLRTIWTPGHSPGHVCFYSEQRRLLLSGDHVLPRISPNIAVHSQQFPNPLGDYLASLRKVRDLEDSEILPAHEWRFRGIGSRVDELVAHHADRMTEIERILIDEPGCTAWDLTLRLTWSRPWDEVPSFMQRAANGETWAHVVLLEEEGRVRREGDGPARFYACS